MFVVTGNYFMYLGNRKENGALFSLPERIIITSDMNDQKAIRGKIQNLKSGWNFPGQLCVLFLLLALSPGCKKDNVETISEITIPILVSDEAQLTPRKGIVVSNNCHGYYEYVPRGYTSSKSLQYPLIIFFHGSGELGNGTSDLSLNSQNAIPRRIAIHAFPDSFLVENKEYRFIAPQFISPPLPADVDNVLTFVKLHYQVDPTRIYLTGFSLGGGAVWAYASSGHANAKKIAAIVPVCGAYSLSANEAKIIATEGLPVWATHNIMILMYSRP
jgi:hypothetical protein